MEPASTECVCRFLGEHLRLGEAVQERFRAQHVDAFCVCSCSADELAGLGVSTLGHQKKLLAFCQAALKRQKEQVSHACARAHAHTCTQTQA